MSAWSCASARACVSAQACVSARACVPIRTCISARDCIPDRDGDFLFSPTRAQNRHRPLFTRASPQARLCNLCRRIMTFETSAGLGARGTTTPMCSLAFSSNPKRHEKAKRNRSAPETESKSKRCVFAIPWDGQNSWVKKAMPSTEKPIRASKRYEANQSTPSATNKMQREDTLRRIGGHGGPRRTALRTCNGVRLAIWANLPIRRRRRQTARDADDAPTVHRRENAIRVLLGGKRRREFRQIAPHALGHEAPAQVGVVALLAGNGVVEELPHGLEPALVRRPFGHMQLV